MLQMHGRHFPLLLLPPSRLTEYAKSIAIIREMILSSGSRATSATVQEVVGKKRRDVGSGTGYKLMKLSSVGSGHGEKGFVIGGLRN